jgi:hypothetical protein
LVSETEQKPGFDGGARKWGGGNDNPRNAPLIQKSSASVAFSRDLFAAFFMPEAADLADV